MSIHKFWASLLMDVVIHVWFWIILTIIHPIDNSFKSLGNAKRKSSVYDCTVRPRKQLNRSRSKVGWIYGHKKSLKNVVSMHVAAKLQYVVGLWRIHAVFKWYRKSFNSHTDFIIDSLNEWKSILRHPFCTTCGVTSYYFPRSNPDGIGFMTYSVKSSSIKVCKIRARHLQPFYDTRQMDILKVIRLHMLSKRSLANAYSSSEPFSLEMNWKFVYYFISG